MGEQMDPATVLEEAADLLLIKGRCRVVRHEKVSDTYCVVGAVEAVDPSSHDGFEHPVLRHIADHLGLPQMKADWMTGLGVAQWSDQTDDDFEVIDTLRLVAKDLRNAAVAS